MYVSLSSAPTSRLTARTSDEVGEETVMSVDGHRRNEKPAERLTNIILDGFKRNFGHGVNLAVTGNTSRPGRHSKALNLPIRRRTRSS